MIDYEKVLSQTIQTIQPSGIRRFFDIANEMQDVISLGIGEPDFATPWEIRKAGIHSLEKGKTWYTANKGLEKLRNAIAEYIYQRLQVRYNAEEVLVTVGGSEAIDIAIRALVNPGDEVIIPQPSFVAYEPITVLAGGVPVIIQCRAEDGFKLTKQALLEKITPKTKLLVLPFPNNPTGAVMRRGDLAEIAEALRDTNIMVLSDEIYSELTYGGIRHESIVSQEGMRERTILINGFSKSFAMTGWRLGFACGPKEIMEQITKIHQYAIMCSPTTSQYAAVQALSNPDEYIQEMVEEYDTRRKLIVDGFNALGLTCFNPEGAFYIFPSIQKSKMTSERFCEELLYAKKVALVPGTAFGSCGEGFVRVSYAYSQKHILKALERIGEFMKDL